MNWKEYQEKAITTMAFRNNEVAITCSLFGICGEFSEYMDKLLHDNLNISTKEYLKELGDIFWYIAVFAYLMDLELVGEYDNNDVYEDEDADNFINIGYLQETVKKIYRNKPYTEITADERSTICYLVSSIYTYILRHVSAWKSTPSEVWQMNIDKLADRKERGVLHSEGDNR